MTEQSLTLLGLQFPLLKLITEREEIAMDEDLPEDERTQAIAACDEQIRLLVVAEVKKVDGIAYNLTEFRRRVGKCWDRGWDEPGAIDLEIERLKALKAIWLARHNYLEDVTIRALQFIEQIEGRKRVDGAISTLALKNNPERVDVAQPELVPIEMQRITLTMPHKLWCALYALATDVEGDIAKQVAFVTEHVDPMKAEIAKVLKGPKTPCQKCGGSGRVVVNIRERGVTPREESCEDCGGSGFILPGVPGCRLTQSVRLEVK